MQLLRTIRTNLSWRTLKTRGRELMLKLVRERATPREVGQAVAIGVLVGTSPALGLHGWLAIGLATLLRRNRLFAFVGSRVSFFLLLPWIVLSQIEVAHYLRVRSFAPIDRHHILAEASTYLLDWCLGWVLLGPLYALLLGLAAVPTWSWYQRRNQLLNDTPPPPPKPSSESPP